MTAGRNGKGKFNWGRRGVSCLAAALFLLGALPAPAESPAGESDPAETKASAWTVSESEAVLMARDITMECEIEPGSKKKQFEAALDGSYRTFWNSNGGKGATITVTLPEGEEAGGVWFQWYDHTHAIAVQIRDENGEWKECGHTEGAFLSDFLPLPEAKIQPQPEHAVFYLVRTLMESDGDIYVAATAPLTNIAMALRIEPRIAGKIKQLVIMGGAICGANASPSAEFNFYADPEAAKIVMDTDIPKVILPLDATWRACITEEQCQELAALGTPAAKFAATMSQKRIDNLKVNDISQHNFDLRHTPGTVASAVLYRYDNTMAPIHDALTIAYLIDPSVITEWVDANVDIEIMSGICDGRMVADIHNTKKGRDPVTARVALNADAAKFTAMLFENLGRK